MSLDLLTKQDAYNIKKMDNIINDVNQKTELYKNSILKESYDLLQAENLTKKDLDLSVAKYANLRFNFTKNSDYLTTTFCSIITFFVAFAGNSVVTINDIDYSKEVSILAFIIGCILLIRAIVKFCKYLKIRANLKILNN